MGSKRRITCEADLDRLVTMAFSRLPHRKVTAFPLSILFHLEVSHQVPPTLKGEGELRFLGGARATYVIWDHSIRKIFPFYSMYLSVQPFIYSRMSSRMFILYFGL